MDNSNESSLSSSSFSTSLTFSLRTIYLKGKSPWGFRIVTSKDESTSNQELIVVSKIRSKSKADLAGLRENDIILMINDISTHKLNIQQANDLIEYSENLSLLVLTNSNISRQERSKSPEKEHRIDSIKLDNMLRSTQNEQSTSSIGINSNNSQTNNIGKTSKILFANPAFTKFIAATAAPSVPTNTNKQKTQLTIKNSSANNQEASNLESNETSYSLNNKANSYTSSFRDSNNSISIANSNYYYDNPNGSNLERFNRSLLLNASTTNQNNSNNQKFKSNYNNNNNLRRNYYSATESNGEDEFDSKPYFNSNRLARSYYYANNNNNIKNSSKGNDAVGEQQQQEQKNRVSYASITLRQPLRDLNYFSDTEAFTTNNSAHKSNKFRNLSNSSSTNYNNNNNNNNRLNKITALYNTNTTRNTNNNLNNRRSSSQISNQHNKLFEADYLTKKTLNSLDSYSNQLNLNDLSSNQHYNTNINNIDSYNNSSILTTVERNNNKSKAMFANNNLVNNNFNRQPHGFSKLGGFHANQTSQQQTSSSFSNQYQANTGPQNPTYVANRAPNVWTPSTHLVAQPQTPPPTQTVRRDSAKDEALEDPVAEKYEREMGSELAKPSNKSNYSDSYFYNSTVFNYPTIDDQKKLARTIAETLEGSNPATSKYHKKKQNIQNQLNKDGYESEPPASLYYSSGNEFNQFTDDQMPQMQKQHLNSYVYDESLPDIIKRSIAQASMTDPVRMVQAPENTRQLHYTEHTTHTQMPPKAAMSLAAALENEQFRGGRGAAIFQKRKAKSEKWVVDESNVKKLPGQQYQPPAAQFVPPSPATQQYPVKFEAFEPKPQVKEHKLEQYASEPKGNFSDFNAKPKGWGNNSDSLIKPVKLAIDNLASQIAHEANQIQSHYQVHEEHHPDDVHQNIEHHPNKLDLSSWTSQKNQTTQHTSQYSVSKDGIQNLKAKFYESASKSSLEPVKPVLLGHSIQSSAPNVNKTKFNKLSSHENYLFNNKNAQNALKISLNSYQNTQPEYDYSGYSSSTDNNNLNKYSNSYSYDDEIAASDL